MLYDTIINGMKRFGTTTADICLHGIGIMPDQINENVIIAPWWEPSILPDLGQAHYLYSSDASAVKVWDIDVDTTKITYIKTGIGAPVLMDVVLSLGGNEMQKNHIYWFCRCA